MQCRMPHHKHLAPRQQAPLLWMAELYSLYYRWPNIIKLLEQSLGFCLYKLVNNNSKFAKLVGGVNTNGQPE